MLKKISNLGIVLSKAELNSIKGGGWISACHFPNGDGWGLDYQHKSDAIAANANCARQGGVYNLYFHPNI